MLVLSRKAGQKIIINDKITITVVRVAQGSVRIGIEAPNDCTIVREEILETADEPETAPTDFAHSD